MSDPDRTRTTLEAESAKWFLRVLVSGGVVAVGCLLEVWETYDTLRNWWRARKNLDPIDNPKSWKIPLAAFGLILVIGGIVAETAYEELASNVDARLRSHESDMISAAERATAVADGKAGDAEKEAGQLKKDAESERLKRVELEVELAKMKAPRKLTKAQYRELVKALKPFPGTEITIDFSFIDGEARALMDQLWAALREAGWKVKFGSPPPYGMSSDTVNTLGVTVSPFGKMTRGGVPIPHRFAVAGDALSKALKNVGLLSKYPGAVIATDNPNESVQMVIGRKP